MALNSNITCDSDLVPLCNDLNDSLESLPYLDAYETHGSINHDQSSLDKDLLDLESKPLVNTADDDTKVKQSENNEKQTLESISSLESLSNYVNKTGIHGANLHVDVTEQQLINGGADDEALLECFKKAELVVELDNTTDKSMTTDSATGENNNKMNDYTVISMPNIPNMQIEETGTVEDNVESNEEEIEDVDFIKYKDCEVIKLKFNEMGYRIPLIITGLLKPRNSHRSRRLRVLTWCIRCAVMLLVTALLLIKFGMFDLTWFVLESKFPFTYTNYILWETRWVVTYIITMQFIAAGHLTKFVSKLELTQNEWNIYKRRLKWYIIVVFVIVVFLPCSFVVLDINYFNVNHLKSKISLTENIILITLIACFRMIVLPCYCMLSFILYLLGKHILAVGKRMCSQRSVSDLEAVWRKLRNFIKSTEDSISLLMLFHMFLIVACSFTTLMSTIERLEMKYSTHNKTTMIKFHVNDQNYIPSAEVIETQKQIEKTRNIIKALQLQPANQTNNGSQVNVLILINELQKGQEKLITNLIQTNRLSNITSTGLSPLYKLVMTINDNYGKIRVILDMFLTLLEILLLYITPLFLVMRTYTYLEDVRGYIWDIDMGKQIKHGYAISDHAKKEYFIDYMKITQGVRIYGYQVQFFKTLFLAVFGLFFGIALRAVWKHFGFI